MVVPSPNYRLILLAFPHSRKQLLISDSHWFWVNYNISLTWIKAIWGSFPLLTMISSEGEQWGRYNLPRLILADLQLTNLKYFGTFWRFFTSIETIIPVTSRSDVVTWFFFPSPGPTIWRFTSQLSMKHFPILFPVQNYSDHMGLSENSVPNDPMVNDHYPY